MKKHELLSPAGDMESLHQAVFNGADAVYLSGHNFGARKFAKNFSNDELVSAIKFCHLYGVKIYITMNTLVYDNEIEEFINQVRFLHQNGVDALIVQDFGMICYLREKFPNLEIHASTQANNSSREGIELLHKLGVKRVVLSRELSIDEIDNIKTPIEKEVFIHGALCISYSGRCLMSSMLGGRSGNRGECAGCCRMEYSLINNETVIEKNKYLLSTKELNTSSNIERLLNSSIDSFKIEGRMKSPLYVGFITYLYRRLIDGKTIDLKVEMNKLKTIFNREFTKGRLFYEKDHDFLNTTSPNHIGLKIGKSEISKGKIKIILDEGQTLHQNDAIRFQKSNQGMIINYLYDKDFKLCSSINQYGYVDNKWNMETNDFVYKTQDSTLEEYILKESRYKIPISFKVEAKIGKPLKISIIDKDYVRESQGEIIEQAVSMPTSKDTIIEKLSRVHDTPFKVENIEINMDDNSFIQIKQLNDLRRCLIEQLIIKRKNDKKDFIEKEVSFTKEEKKEELTRGYTCSVIREDQLEECLKHNFLRIYVSNSNLYEKYKQNKNVYYQLPKCNYNYDNVLAERIMTNDIYMDKTHILYGGYQLNNTNKYTGYYLKKIGYKNIPLSCEMNSDKINQYIKEYQNEWNGNEFEILSYGREENMLIKGNILNIETNNYQYIIKDIYKRLFPVYYDGYLTHILNHKKRNYEDYKKINCIHRFDFYEETPIEIANIVNQLD